MKKFLILTILLSILFFAFKPKIDFRSHYNTDYESALEFLKGENKAFNFVAHKYKLDKKLLQSIIFPELLRYNLFQNFIETKALELLYINGGTEAADFSIGSFQMKPSFVEKLEHLAAADENSNWAENYFELCSYGNIDLKSQRKERIERLSSLSWQLKYLCFFCHYIQKKYNLNFYFILKLLCFFYCFI